jgi:hypothetical protein
MVRGINKFKEYFGMFSEQYTFIGGAACDLLMSDAGLDFRATKDLDVVLIFEALTKEFGNRFWNFIKDAGYELKEKSNGELQFYRFAKPKNIEYPYMIELFSKKPDTMTIPEDMHLTPIHISDECSSLSAILLNDDYYSTMLNGRITIEDIPVLKTEYIILFKAKAYLDLSERKSKGEDVDSKNIKKHKNDIFRLISLLMGTERVLTEGTVHDDIMMFIDKMQYEDIDMKSLGITTITKEQAINMLKNIYQ